MKRLLATTIIITSIMLGKHSYAADDAEISLIKNQLNALMKRVESLEKENNQLRSKISNNKNNIDKTKAASLKSNKKSTQGLTINAPSVDTKLTFGGYVKADAIMDIGSGYGNDLASFASIPLDGSNSADQSSDFHMHARQTRLNVTSSTNTSMGDLKVFAEVDFYGTRGSDLVTNGHSPQLRQAYGEINGILAGQTWTNFMDLGAYPESLDFVGPVGITLLRQTQMRYSDDLDNGIYYSVSIENPNSDFTNGGSDTVSANEKMPDLVGSITHKTDWGHWSARGLLRQISVENSTTNDTDSEIGYATSISAKINTGDKNNLKLRATYGDGVGRYLYDVATSSKAAAYNNGELETQKVFAGYGSYQHHWSDKWRSNFMGGYVNIDNEVSLIGNAQNQNIWSAHANLIWQPVKDFKFGLEYIYGHRELDNGTEGELNRTMASAIYNF